MEEKKLKKIMGKSQKIIWFTILSLGTFFVSIILILISLFGGLPCGLFLDESNMFANNCINYIALPLNIVFFILFNFFCIRRFYYKELKT